MCGLFGMAGHGIIKDDLKIIDELMLTSSTRGDDGTGLVAGKSFKGAGAGHGYKVGGDPFYFRAMLKNEHLVYDVSNTWFIGHTRGRSVGAINDASAQPFGFKRIIGTHNGTISGNFNPFHTDSQKLLSRIDLNPEALKETIGSLDHYDSYALVWFDKETKDLHFLRNKTRGLFFAMNNKRAVMYWASERRFIDFALYKEEYTVYYFEENKHYTIPISGIKHSGKVDLTYEVIDPPTEKPVFEIDNDNVVVLSKDGQLKTIGETEEELNSIPWIRDTTKGPKRKVH